MKACLVHCLGVLAKMQAVGQARGDWATPGQLVGGPCDWLAQEFHLGHEKRANTRGATHVRKKHRLLQWNVHGKNAASAGTILCKNPRGIGAEF